MLLALMAAVMGVSDLPRPQPQDPRTTASRLPEIVVEGRPVDVQARRFIGEIAAPSRGESLARWRDTLCVGAAGFDADGARFVVDRVSAAAAEV